jgi:uncharacterized protein YndB with AHSA1/START domain
MSNSSTAGAARRDLVFTRIFDAPVERVWRAWTEGQMMELSRMGMEQCLDKMAALFSRE